MNSDTKIISIIVIITVIIVSLGLLLAGGGQASNAPEFALDKVALIRDYSPRLSLKDATSVKIQMVEFGDFECPSCAMLHSPLSRILKEYENKIDYIYRIIPIHKSSKAAAAAAYAAGEQGMYFAMYDKLFEQQDAWSSIGADTTRLFAEYAKEIGLNVARYNSDLNKNAELYSQRVDQDAADAQKMNVFSTPTLIINGKALVKGAISYDKLKAVIDEEIKNVENNPVASVSATISDSNTKPTLNSNSASTSAPKAN